MLPSFCVLTRWVAQNLQVDGGVESKGIIISSSGKISVFLAQIDSFYTPQEYMDATEISPISGTQLSYHVVNHVNAPTSCATGFRNDFFAVSSSEDNTTVTVTSPTDSSSSYVLNRFETYSEIAEYGFIELSGYKIESSAPVTLVAGNLCTYNYADVASTGTYITSHRPVDKYGIQYVVPSIEAPRNSGYDVHVVASMDDTTVNIDGQVVVLQADDILIKEFYYLSEATLVNCTFPCNVIQFSKAYDNYNGMFAIDVIPTDEFYTRATFTTSQELTGQYVTVIVDSATPVGDILLDGVVFDPVWSTAEGFTYATADVEKGYHLMNSTASRFAVYTYAHALSEGGGYGFAVLPAGKYA